MLLQQPADRQDGEIVFTHEDGHVVDASQAVVPVPVDPDAQQRDDAVA